MPPTSKLYRWIAIILGVAAGIVFVFVMVHHAIGPRRYMEMRYEIEQGRITEDDLRRDIGEEDYKAYREFVDSLPPLPPRK